MPPKQIQHKIEPLPITYRPQSQAVVPVVPQQLIHPDAIKEYIDYGKSCLSRVLGILEEIRARHLSDRTVAFLSQSAVLLAYFDLVTLRGIESREDALRVSRRYFSEIMSGNTSALMRDVFDSLPGGQGTVEALRGLDGVRLSFEKLAERYNESLELSITTQESLACISFTERQKSAIPLFGGIRFSNVHVGGERLEITTNVEDMVTEVSPSPQRPRAAEAATYIPESDAHNLAMEIDAAAQEEIEEHRETIKYLSQELDTMSKNNEDLHRQLEHLGLQAHEYAQKSNHSEEDKRRLASELEVAKSVVEQQREELHHHAQLRNEHLVRMQLAESSREAALRAREASHARHGEVVAKMESAHVAAKGSITQHFGKQVQSLKDTIAAVEAERAALESQLTDVQKVLAQKSVSKEEKAKLVEAYEKIHAQLRQEMANHNGTRTERDHAAARAMQHEKTIASLKNDLHFLQKAPKTPAGVTASSSTIASPTVVPTPTSTVSTARVVVQAPEPEPAPILKSMERRTIKLEPAEPKALHSLADGAFRPKSEWDQETIDYFKPKPKSEDEERTAWYEENIGLMRVAPALFGPKMNKPTLVSYEKKCKFLDGREGLQGLHVDIKTDRELLDKMAQKQYSHNVSRLKESHYNPFAAEKRAAGLVQYMLRHPGYVNDPGKRVPMRTIAPF